MAAPNSVFLITGCSSGLGLEMAKAALQRGFRVIATARRVETLEALKEQGAVTLTLDVTASPQDLKILAKEAWNIYGQVDFLVNNAGYVQAGAFEENTPEEVQQQFQTNVFGVINLTNAFLPYLRKRRAGMIVNISSQGGSLNIAGAGVYCATKAAMDSFTDTWARELAEFTVRFISIQPGMFRTPVSGANIKRGSNHVSEYTVANTILKGYQAQTGTERGDPVAGATRIVDFVTQHYATPKLPLRLALGDDAWAALKEVREQQLVELDQWKEWSVGTDFPGHAADSNPW
uniref:Short-chain dehydrogenase/reductase family protein n=1 Tax=Mycena chlorophos TaxID=658473 RepID=A0ABQ0L6Z5_MYCCL|nr:short-chain dehydrogenase/reductase family protein [Mycena chlorophos]